MSSSRGSSSAEGTSVVRVAPQREEESWYSMPTVGNSYCTETSAQSCKLRFCRVTLPYRNATNTPPATGLLSVSCGAAVAGVLPAWLLSCRQCVVVSGTISAQWRELQKLTMASTCLGRATAESYVMPLTIKPRSFGTRLPCCFDHASSKQELAPWSLIPYGYAVQWRPYKGRVRS